MDGPLSIADQDALARGCYFDADAAERVRIFYRQFLRHSKGQWAGKPFELLDWQWHDVVRPLFGWRRANGTRRFRRAYIEIPKKNGKSTLAAGTTIYLTVADGEPGSEVYTAANDKFQASIIFREVHNMIEASPALKRRFKITASTKEMRCGKNTYKALSADVPTKEGLNIHGLVYDELHAAKSRSLWDTLTFGGAARRQPLQIAITTAGDNKESICWEQHQYAADVISGKHLDPDFFGLIYAAGDKDEWTAPAVWHKANPSLGSTLNVDEFAAECRAAQHSPAKEAAFKRYRLNIWSETSADVWMPVEMWDACQATIPREKLLGQRCFMGIDLSATQALTSLVLYFPDFHAVLPWFWLPAEAGKTRERLHKARLDQWIRSGHITQVPGAIVDFALIRLKANELRTQYRVLECGIDPWAGIQLATELRSDGLKIFLFRQGMASMSEPTKRLGQLILEQKLIHFGHPVLRWNFAHTVVDVDAAENLKPSKDKSTDRIDGIVALVVAIGMSLATRKSVYDERGLSVL